jgi:tetratricopeptide (TPR) repeat protein
LAPDKVQNYIDFANLAFVHKSFPVGISMVDAGLRRQPDSAPLYLSRGVLKAQITEQLPSAIKDFEHAHTLDPKLSLSIDALGIIKTQQYNDADSRELFEKQSKLNPDDPVLQYLLAEQLSQIGQNSDETLKQAITAAKRAVSLDPRYVPARNLLAKLYLRANEPKLAVEQAESALKDEPGDQEALYQKLVATRRLGDRAAVQQLTKQFEVMRNANSVRQKSLDRFRLEEVKGHQ